MTSPGKTEVWWLGLIASAHMLQITATALDHSTVQLYKISRYVHFYKNSKVVKSACVAKIGAAIRAGSPMSETREKIVEAAIRTFVRFGPRKAAMADIADEAGVSRQTLYDLFGNKDELIAASIEYVTDQNLRDVEAGLQGCDALGAQLDLYFSKTIVRSFDLIQSSAEAADLMANHTDAGREAMVRTRARHTKLVARLLSPFKGEVETSEQSVNQLAHFVVTTAMAFKYSARDKRDLNSLLASLKLGVLSVVGENASGT